MDMMQMCYVKRFEGSARVESRCIRTSRLTTYSFLQLHIQKSTLEPLRVQYLTYFN